MQFLKLFSFIAVALLVSVVFSGLVSIPAIAATEVQSSSKRVMFRDDDVTPWSLGALRAVNQVHIDEGVPVTLGVIPAQSFRVQSQGNPYVPTTNSPETFVDYLRSLASSGQFELPTYTYEEFVDYLRPLASSGQFELAQHGYQHSDNSKLYGIPDASEFRGMPYSEQYTLIKKGRSLMQNAFGAAPTTFIPPFNTGDENTLTALSKLGFTVYSSNTYDFGSTSERGLTLKPQLLEISDDATYASLVRQTQALLSDPSVNNIVITYHNWKFEANRTAHTINTSKVEMLRHYIQYLKTNNVEFTTLNGAHPSNRVTAHITLATSNPSPTVGQSVTFTATLKSGTKPLSGKSVTIYHYLNGVKYIDTTKTTNANGQVTVTQRFGSTGIRTYYATFAGDSSYGSSTSSVVTIYAGSGSRPTTSNLMPASQSAQPNANVLIKGYLRTGATGIGGQTVELWAQRGTGSWYELATGTTGTGTSAGYVTFNVEATGHVAQTTQYYVVFPGAGAYAAAKSNVIAVKFELTRTTPYQTALYAYALKQVVTKGTTNPIWVRLMNGATPLTGKYVYVWKWSGGRWVSVSRIITRTGTQAGWALADYRINNAGTGLYKFVFYGPLPYDRSTSNAVQLIWT